MKLYVIRHAQSLLNIGIGKTPNVGLSDFGKKQADCIRKFFGGKDVDVIYCSPFKRVIETALPLAQEKELPIILAPEMCEFFHEHALDYRDYHWELTTDIMNEFPLARFHEKQTAPQWWPAWPEQQEDVTQRVTNFYENEIIGRHLNSDRTIIVFGHGATTGELKGLVNSETMNPCPNAGIYEYEINANGECMDYQAHLEHLGEYTYNLDATAY